MAEGKRTERQTRATRTKSPERIPVGGHRDLLTVRFKDQSHPEKFYSRWVLDTTEQGNRILRFLQAGYEFVPSDEVDVGQPSVYKHEDVGSIVRQPAGGDGQYLYLMRLPMEWHEEDNRAKQKQVDATEESLYKPDSLRGDEEGVYGSIKIGHKLE